MAKCAVCGAPSRNCACYDEAVIAALEKRVAELEAAVQDAAAVCVLQGHGPWSDLLARLRAALEPKP